MTTERDPYSVLGLTREATQAEINRAYRRLLRRHHPDTRPLDHPKPGVGTEDPLPLVLAAYAVLHDPTRRAEYDAGTAAAVPHRLPDDADSGRAIRVTHRRAGQRAIQVGPVRWHTAQALRDVHQMRQPDELRFVLARWNRV